MDRLWKYLMQLDAKALFFGSVALFVVVTAIVAWLYFRRASPAAEKPTIATAVPVTATPSLGILGVISNQISAKTLVVPVCPFRPTIENMALHRTNWPTTGPTTNMVRLPSKIRYTFPGLRPSTNATVVVIPQLTFRGYFQRPDGTPAAFFFDSAANASKFFIPGDDIHGATLVSADIHSAKVKKPNGETLDLALGDSFTAGEIRP